MICERSLDKVLQIWPSLQKTALFWDALRILSIAADRNPVYNRGEITLEEDVLMEDNVSRALIETVVRRALRDIDDSPERSSRNLIDMALTFAEGRFQQTIFQTAQRLLCDEHSAYYAHFAHAPVSYFSDKNRVDRGVICENGVILRVNGNKQQEIMRADEIKLPGEHNLLNYLAAFAAVDGLVSNEVCRQVAMRFAGVEHRLEQVRVLNGVTYINDSIGTSPTRTSAGLHALKVKPIVIAGGYDKHIPFDGLGNELCQYAKRVFLTGDTAKSIHKAIVNSPCYAESGLEVRMIDDFKEAVLAASASAEPGDIVLLSPACAAFDRFKNFA